MFRLIKKHLKGCKESSEAVFAKCSKGKLCPFYAVYPDPEALARRRKKSLETANYLVAIAKLRQFEADCYAGPKEAPKTLDQAIVHFLATKKHRSKDRQRKLREHPREGAAYWMTPESTVSPLRDMV